MKSFEEEWAKVKDVGITRMLDESTAHQMYEVLKQYVPIVCVEFGTNQAKSACFIGNIIKQWNGHLYCFDPYLLETSQDIADLEGINPDVQYRIALDNIANMDLTEDVTVHRTRSIDSVNILKDLDVDLVYIDGDHSRSGLQTDVSYANSLIKTKGVVLIDNWPDVCNFYSEVESLYLWKLIVSNYQQAVFEVNNVGLA